ncbi:MAG: metallophosphoesterase [Nitrosomonadales bacterium]|nr:metallophosphoesterase [Nitrosomonadales bacterium]
MKLIHISDTHIGRGDNALRFERVVEDLLKNPPDAPGNCVVVHTGDLIDSATEANRRAARVLLDRLAARYRVLLSPGNHDYGNAVSVSNEDALAFQQAFGDYIFQGKPASFPVLSEVGAGYVFIGLDSNAEELKFLDRLFAEGRLGGNQLWALNHMLDSPAVAGRQAFIYMHHHPFSFGYSVMPDVGDGKSLYHLFAQLTRPFRRLKDAYSFCQVARDRVQGVLFGHMHYGLDCSGDARKYGIQLALDGSSTTCTDNDGEDRMRYRVIDLSDLSQTTRMLKL